MKTQTTTVIEGEKIAVEILIADSATIEEATEFLRFRIFPEKAQSHLGLEAIKLKAFERAKAILADEMQVAGQKIEAGRNRG